MSKLRRAKVAKMKALKFSPEEMLVNLHREFPELNIQKVYNDIHYIKRNDKAFIALEYLPELGHHFHQIDIGTDFVIGEAYSKYQTGTEEKRIIKGQNGQTEILIQKKEPAAMLRIMLEAFKLKMAMGDSNVSLRNIEMLTSELQRYRSLDRQEQLNANTIH